MKKIFAMLGYSKTSDLVAARKEVEGWRKCRESIGELARRAGIFVAEDDAQFDAENVKSGVLVTGCRVRITGNLLVGGCEIIVAPCASDIYIADNFFKHSDSIKEIGVKTE